MSILSSSSHQCFLCLASNIYFFYSLRRSWANHGMYHSFYSYYNIHFRSRRHRTKMVVCLCNWVISGFSAFRLWLLLLKTSRRVVYRRWRRNDKRSSITTTRRQPQSTDVSAAITGNEMYAIDWVVDFEFRLTFCNVSIHCSLIIFQGFFRWLSFVKFEGDSIVYYCSGRWWCYLNVITQRFPND